ncbi:MAG: DUF402 domain-containing protein [Actinomycetota bacterium]
MWSEGALIVRRELLGFSPVGSPPDPRPWHGRSWLDVPVYVVEDSPDALVTYIATGARFGYHDGPWPADGGVHPWYPRPSWEGEGCLMVQRPGEHHAVWHFWNEPDRGFSNWYINMQTAFARTDAGYDTQDLEVDFVVRPDGTWQLKDYEVLGERLAEGRFWPELDDWIRAYTAELSDRLDRGERWWDQRWAAWAPPPEWRDPVLPQASI